MTYKELLAQLLLLDEEQLRRTVTVCDSKFDCGQDNTPEYYHAEFGFSSQCDLLDEDHPIIRF